MLHAAGFDAYVQGTSNRKAQRAFDEIRLQYEQDEQERQRIEAEEKELLQNNHPDALLPFTEYVDKWLLASKPSLATTTFQGYRTLIKARIKPYFDPLKLRLMDVNAHHIDDFYQTIFDDGCTANTVIHYHSIINKVFKTAIKKKVLRENPMGEIDRPKKNVYRATFYSVDEMMTLLDVFEEDPLDLPVKVAAYYGLRRSEVLPRSSPYLCKPSSEQGHLHQTDSDLAGTQHLLHHRRHLRAPGHHCPGGIRNGNVRYVHQTC